MKKLSLLLLACGIFSTPIFSEPLDGDCPLNSSCTFRIEGQTNKIIHTYRIAADKNYVCTVTDGNGNLFNINNVIPSPGVRWLQQGRFDNPLNIFGPPQGEGAITYTLHNNNKFWKFDRIRYECKEQH